MPLNIADRIFAALSELDNLAAGNWKEISKREFEQRIEDSLKIAKRLKQLINEIKLKAKIKGMELQSATFEANLNELISLLERNLKLERGKRWAKKLQTELTEEEKEAQRELQRRIMEFVITSRLALERILIDVRKRIAIPRENFAKLLEMKEKEIDELKMKRGRIDFDDSEAEILAGFDEIAAELKEEAARFSKKIIEEKAALERAANSVAKISEEYKSIYNAIVKIIENSRKLFTILKKQREEARNIALQIEAETIRLRNAYASELLGMQATRENLEKSIEEKFRKRIDELEKMLKEKNSIIEHLKVSLSEKNSEINSLKEELKYTKDLLKATENEKKVANIELNSLKRKLKRIDNRITKQKKTKKTKVRKKVRKRQGKRKSKNRKKRS